MVYLQSTIKTVTQDYMTKQNVTVLAQFGKVQVVN